MRIFTESHIIVLPPSKNLKEKQREGCGDECNPYKYNLENSAGSGLSVIYYDNHTKSETPENLCDT